MACKICDKKAVYDLVCEREGCGAKAAEICNGPMCQFDLWRVRKNERRSCIPLMNGECEICGAALQQVLTGSGQRAYRFNNATRAVFRTGHHRVEQYTDGWEEGSKIVSDALHLLGEWQSLAKAQRTERETWKSSEKGDDRCSGDDWNTIDEGMDVATEIASVEKNGRRKECSLWKVSDSESGKVIGILIMWPFVEIPLDQLTTSKHVDELSVAVEYKKVWHGIRWLIGHPTVKGAGEALIAQADAMHRECRMPWMHVIGAASSAVWYASKGFKVLAPSECESEGTDCGCQVMVKKLAGI